MKVDKDLLRKGPVQIGGTEHGPRHIMVKTMINFQLAIQRRLKMPVRGSDPIDDCSFQSLHVICTRCLGSNLKLVDFKDQLKQKLKRHNYKISNFANTFLR